MEMTDGLSKVLGKPHASAAPLDPTDDPELLLVFTIDTECSVERQHNPDPSRVVDELIFGDFGGGGPPGGIGLHMDLLEHFGFRGCFFVDVLMEYQYGRRAVERTIEAIAERGHEIELHVHPHNLMWSSDRNVTELSKALWKPDQDAFRRLIELSVDLFERRVGRRPIAYRAGGYRIADMHFPVLREHGIRIDSSVRFHDQCQVSDWMRTRTRPFWVDGVLEMPPTSVLLRDDADAWKVRSFVPQGALSVDPLPALSSESDGVPQVATYVSHSFQLLRAKRETDPAVLAAWAARVRPTLPARMVDRAMRKWEREILTYGDDIDGGLVTPLAEMLRGVAERDNARCVTYAELDRVVNRYWGTTPERPTDAIVVLDRRRGLAATTGTRVFGEHLLSHLAVQWVPSPDSEPDETDSDNSTGTWLDTSSQSLLRHTLDRAALAADDGPPFVVRAHTLGVGPVAGRGALPALAEVLFPREAVRRAAANMDAEIDEIAWDVPTLLAWLESRGFAVRRTRRMLRRATELAAIDRFSHKLRWLDPYELRTGTVDVELRRQPRRREQPRTTAPSIELFHDELTVTGVLPTNIAPEVLPTTAANLYAALQPGHELRLRVAADPRFASRTTTVLAMLRAGFEVLDATPVDAAPAVAYRLLRPVELSDIRRFGGMA